jgi:2,3-diketo-5-methylthio-1-phosphopentane phosphatase
MDFVVLCDFDGTITQIDTAEFVLSRFARGNWRAFDEQFEKGIISLEECLKREFSLVRASEKQILNELKNVVTFRPHFEELATYCKRNNIPLEIASAGLDFVISHFLELKSWQNLVTVHAPKTRLSTSGIKFAFPKLVDKTSVNFKQDLVRHYKNDGKKVAYIGDGSGDYAAARDSDYRFAVDGSRLARLCKKNNVHCMNIVDFQEVLKTIQETNIQSASKDAKLTSQSWSHSREFRNAAIR